MKSRKRSSSNDWANRLTDFEFGWLAGLLEGDGCFTYDEQDVRIQVRMTDLDTVSRAANLLGVAVYGPYKQSENDGHLRKDAYMCFVRGKRALSMMKTLQPYMSLRRQHKIQELIGCQKELFEFPRNIPLEIKAK